MSLQEKIFRGDVGWSVFEEEGLCVISHRAEAVWRGAGVGFRSSEWAVLQKRADERGVWVRLRRRSDGAHFWIGSAHITQGATKELHACEVKSFLKTLPPTTFPACLGMDGNTPISWGHTGLEMEAAGGESKGDEMLGLLLEQGFQLSPPPVCQRSLPTCRPRKTDVQGRHIDVVGARRCMHEGRGIVRDSHCFVGSDHDMVVQQVGFASGGTDRRGRPNTRPRSVKADIRVPDVIDQQVLEGMAAVTQPYKGVAYKDSEAVKVYFRVARQTKSAEAWKRALSEREKERRAWREERIRAANNGDRSAYREHTKKGITGWEAHIASSVLESGGDPHQAVHGHFQRIYRDDVIPEFPYKEVPLSDDFTVEELRDGQGWDPQG